MKKEIKEKIIKLVDDICSDETGADKPYQEHLEKWAKEIQILISEARLDEKKKTIKEMYNNFHKEN